MHGCNHIIYRCMIIREKPYRETRERLLCKVYFVITIGKKKMCHSVKNAHGCWATGSGLVFTGLPPLFPSLCFKNILKRHFVIIFAMQGSKNSLWDILPLSSAPITYHILSVSYPCPTSKVSLMLTFPLPITHVLLFFPWCVFPSLR